MKGGGAGHCCDAAQSGRGGRGRGAAIVILSVRSERGHRERPPPIDPADVTGPGQARPALGWGRSERTDWTICWSPAASTEHSRDKQGDDDAHTLTRAPGGDQVSIRTSAGLSSVVLPLPPHPPPRVLALRLWFPFQPAQLLSEGAAPELRGQQLAYVCMYQRSSGHRQFPPARLC